MAYYHTGSKAVEVLGRAVSEYCEGPICNHLLHNLFGRLKLQVALAAFLALTIFWSEWCTRMWCIYRCMWRFFCIGQHRSTPWFSMIFSINVPPCFLLMFHPAFQCGYNRFWALSPGWILAFLALDSLIDEFVFWSFCFLVGCPFGQCNLRSSNLQLWLVLGSVLASLGAVHLMDKFLYSPGAGPRGCTTSGAGRSESC